MEWESPAGDTAVIMYACRDVLVVSLVIGCSEFVFIQADSETGITGEAESAVPGGEPG